MWCCVKGWCNNIAWNVGPLTWRQYQLALERYEYNKVEGMKSIVPMTHLSWNLARNVKATDAKLFELIKRTLLRTLRQTALVQDLIETTLRQVIHWHCRSEMDPAPYCNNCEVSIYSVHVYYSDYCRHNKYSVNTDCHEP